MITQMRKFKGNFYNNSHFKTEQFLDLPNIGYISSGRRTHVKANPSRKGIQHIEGYGAGHLLSLMMRSVAISDWMKVDYGVI